MAMFIDIHSNMTGITEEELRREHDKDVEAQASEPGVRFIKAWADPAAGKVFCLSEGPNKDAVQRVHANAGHPSDEIFELAIEME